MELTRNKGLGIPKTMKKKVSLKMTLSTVTNRTHPKSDIMPPRNSQRQARRKPNSTNINVKKAISLSSGCAKGLGTRVKITTHKAIPTSTVPTTRAVHRKIFASNLMFISA
jgi:hypothetical protein